MTVPASPPASNGAKWAVVTGSTSGIGRATAETLAREGWSIVLHGRTESDHAIAALDAVRAITSKTGAHAEFEAADLGKADAIGPFVDRTWHLSSGGVNAWVHNAGVDLLTGPNAKKNFVEKMLLATQIDLWGTMLTCRAVGERMYSQGHGSLVTIGWDQAATGMEGDSGQLFAAIKGGIMAFTRSLAKSLAPSVRVNGVAPGWIKTSWGEGASDYWQERVRQETPLKRWGTPEDIAGTIAFLVSDRSQFLTGQILNVNGGVVCN